MNAWQALEQIVEGPRTNARKVDWQKSFKSATKGQSYYDKASHHVPKVKAPKLPDTEPSPARANPASGDPEKVSTNAEVFEADNGAWTYVVLKAKLGAGHPGTGRYMLIAVGPGKKTDVSDHANRAEALDAMLHHHDKGAAGL